MTAAWMGHEPEVAAAMARDHDAGWPCGTARAASGNGRAVLGPGGLVTGWDEAARAMFGYEAAEIAGRSATIPRPPTQAGDRVFADELRQAMRDGRAASARWHVRRDGKRLWVACVTRPTMDGAGRPAGFVRILRDDTVARLEAGCRAQVLAVAAGRSG